MALLRPGVVHADYLKPLPIRPEGLRQIPAALGVGTAYFDKPSTNKLIKAFVHKKNKGQQRAFGNLVRLFAPAGVTLQTFRLTGADPLIVWSMLKPRFAPFEEDSQRSCVAINYLIAGKVSGQTLGLADGLWTLEVSDHALGRMFQRLGKGCDPEAVLMDAHRNFLRLRTDVVTAAIDLHGQFPVKAGAGAFICEARTEQMNEVTARGFFANTYLSDEMLGADQVLLKSWRCRSSWLRGGRWTSSMLGRDGRRAMD